MSLNSQIEISSLLTKNIILLQLDSFEKTMLFNYKDLNVVHLFPEMICFLITVLPSAEFSLALIDFMINFCTEALSVMHTFSRGFACVRCNPASPLLASHPDAKLLEDCCYAD